MLLRSLLMLRSNLLSLLAVLCLWPAISAEAKPDTLEERPASLAEVQTKAAKGFVKQELELAADYFVGRGVPKDLTQSAYWYRTREIPPPSSISAICIPLVWAYPRIKLRQFDGTGEPHPQITRRQR
jgi:hypothetical protein